VKSHEKGLVSVFSLLETDISTFFTIPGRSKTVFFSRELTLGARQDNPGMEKN